MLSERYVHPDVRELLMSGEPFQYAHLIKFERPARPDDSSGGVSTSEHRYTYLTDASRDVPFDDLSKDHNGSSNGTQIYIANKVLQVSGVPESIEAKASNFTITLDGNGIGAVISDTVSIIAIDANTWDIQWSENTDIIGQGFREGDKVLLSGSRTGSFNIHSFRANNILRIKKVEDGLTIGTDLNITMSLSSEEIKSVLLDKLDESYASFINREVFVYRAYFKDGLMVGQNPAGDATGPVLMFKGIISSVNFEDTEEGIKVQWSLTSHWGDFAQIKGRITSDDFHRALNENGVPQPYSAIKTIYAFDKGFMHAETSLNLLTDYTVQVEKQKVKAKNGFLGLGIGSKVKVKKYYETETRHSSLDFQLTARSIPVVYGVRNIEGIPVFADTLLNDASSVYVIHALCEGEIGGIYDVYIDGKSMVCANQSDLDVRSVQNEEMTIDVLCSGRADRGDVLLGTNSIGPESGNELYYQPVFAADDLWLNPYAQYNSYSYQINYQAYVPPVTFTASPTSAGLTHGKSLTLTTQQSITLDFFAGKEDQVASPALVNIAASQNFKVQNDYWVGGGTVEYWGPNHRLLDTAYVVSKYKIAEGETTIPTLEFIVKGKVLDCYNYDYSYTHDDKATGENADNFKLGQTVTLRRNSGSLIASNVQIIDKWTIILPDGSTDTRFRWSQNPDLNVDEEGIPDITEFYMESGANTWSMVTWNHSLDSGTISVELSGEITGFIPDPVDGGVIIDIPPEAPIHEVPNPAIGTDDSPKVVEPITVREPIKVVYQ